MRSRAGWIRGLSEIRPHTELAADRCMHTLEVIFWTDYEVGPLPMVIRLSLRLPKASSLLQRAPDTDEPSRGSRRSGRGRTAASRPGARPDNAASACTAAQTHPAVLVVLIRPRTRITWQYEARSTPVQLVGGVGVGALSGFGTYVPSARRASGRAPAQRRVHVRDMRLSAQFDPDATCRISFALRERGISP